MTLVERYPYLGGLASGGMVLVLDDMTNGDEITVTGICTGDDRPHGQGRRCRVPAAGRPPRRTGRCTSKWARWGAFDFRAQTKPQPIVMAAAFDPDGWKRISNEMIAESRRQRSAAFLVLQGDRQDGRIKGVICETKAGREAIMGEVVIDTTGDLDVAAAAGAKFNEGKYIVTTVFRLGGVDADEVERFQEQDPEAYAKVDRAAKRVMGGSWDFWWLKTPLPGIVWCNCPHMTGYDALNVEDLSRADFEGRKRIYALVDFVRANMPGFQNAFVVDVAPQLGVRTTRLLEGEYVVTKDDVMDRVHFADTVARGRDYYTPYRAMLPKEVDGLLVAGRHYSATEAAQKMSREIPPCMSMGQSAGVAAALAVQGNISVKRVDAAAIRARVRAQGGDPGDVPSANATTHGERRVTAPAELPLAGIKIVDFTQVMMGPVATQVLADFGADVIKVERPPTGDLSRTSFPNDPGRAHGPGLLLAEPQQALHRARPAQAGRQGRRAAIARPGRCGREQFPGGRHGPDGFRL